jgi:flagellar basal-body rod protein FlgB
MVLIIASSQFADPRIKRDIAETRAHLNPAGICHVVGLRYRAASADASARRPHQKKGCPWVVRSPQPRAESFNSAGIGKTHEHNRTSFGGAIEYRAPENLHCSVPGHYCLSELGQRAIISLSSGGKSGKRLILGLFGAGMGSAKNRKALFAMIDAIFGDPNYVAAKKLLDINVLRHEAIASNIANVETPNYKRMDVAPSFEAQLSQAVAGRDATQIAALQPELAVDSKAVTGRADGNTVQLEDEMLKLNQNMVEHSLETQLVSYNLSKMRLAITGKAS